MLFIAALFRAEKWKKNGDGEICRPVKNHLDRRIIDHRRSFIKPCRTHSQNFVELLPVSNYIATTIEFVSDHDERLHHFAYDPAHIGFLSLQAGIDQDLFEDRIRPQNSGCSS